MGTWAILRRTLAADQLLGSVEDLETIGDARRSAQIAYAGAAGSGRNPVAPPPHDCFADAMSRLELRAIDVGEGERILAGLPGPQDRWAPDYPFEGDIIAVTVFLVASDEQGDQHPFGYYQIVQRASGEAIGGIGFKGRPVDGCVEIGYGLAPSARGHGYAAEAVSALLSIAARNGITRVVADTTPDNSASRRTLERAGFRLRPSESSQADGLCDYEITLDGVQRDVTSSTGPTPAADPPATS